MTSVAEISDAVRAMRQRLSVRVGEAQVLAKRGQELVNEVTVLADERATADRVSGVLSKIGSERDAAARAQVEGLVTSGLQAIFEENLSFHLVESTSRQTPQIDFVVRTHLPDGSSFETDVMNARGGGLAAVVGLLLRVVLILLTRASGKKAPDVLVLDETLAHLSREYLDAAGQFLRTLCDSTGLQLIIVTHQQELVEFADVSYRLRLDANGRTVATKEV
jgi:DNA repair exonuclease SbcCD ATPase subunit